MDADADRDLLDAANAREDARQAAEWKRKQQYESAAKAAHKIRQTYRLLQPKGDVRGWDELPVSSQRHLIADAENVAANPQITGVELHRLYQERLLAEGDADSPDLRSLSDEDQTVEDHVLRRLKEVLAAPPLAGGE